MQRDYSDIIHLPHHQSSCRKHMSMHDRAAQFAPFAALTGYHAAIKETARQTERKIELDEGMLAEINYKMQKIQNNMYNKPRLKIVYFVPDGKKNGGQYMSYEGNIRRIDEVKQVLIFTDGKEIAMNDVIQICSNMLDENI